MQHLNEKESLVDFNDLFKGRCFLKYKNTQMDTLQTQIKDLYKLVNSDSNDKTILIEQSDEDVELE
jgi:hypothetical protein